ncbi:MAG: ThuA domain-containing protein [Ginsengibacter sp.]
MKNKSLGKQKNKIVFIAGPASHGSGEHEYRGGCRLLAKLLNENAHNVEAVVYDGKWPDEPTAFDDAKTIVIYADGGEGHMIIPHMQEMEKLMKNGVGLVLLHYAVEIPKGELGNHFLNWVGGYFETYWSVNPYWTPTFDNLPKNEITRGVKPFSIDDEWYYHIRFPENIKNVTPILVDLPPKSSLDRPDGSHDNNAFVRADVDKGIPQIMAWSFERPGGGRGFGFTGGHMHRNWMNDDFRKLVLNAILWSAKIQVPKNGLNSATPTQSEMDNLLYKK